MIEGNLHQWMKRYKKGRKDSDASALWKKRADGVAAAARVQRAANAPFDQAVYSVRLAPLALWVSTYQSRWRTQIMSSSAQRLRLICLFSSFFFFVSFFFCFQASLFISKLVECCGAEEEAENCSSPKSSDDVFCVFLSPPACGMHSLLGGRKTNTWSLLVGGTLDEYRIYWNCTDIYTRLLFTWSQRFHDRRLVQNLNAP